MNTFKLKSSNRCKHAANSWHYLLLVACLIFVQMQTTNAEELLPKPVGPVILTITGNISKFNKSTSEYGGADNKLAEFDMAMLEKIGLDEFNTNTPWTDSKTLFSGVRMNKLLKYVGAKSNQVRASAYDDYHNTLRDINFDKYPIIVATKRNGKPMSLRNLGPLWIMFPFDDYPELVSETNNANCVWQLRALEVQ